MQSVRAARRLARFGGWMGAALLAVPVVAAPTATIDDAEVDVAQEFPDYVFACPDGGYQSGCDASDVEQAVALDGVDAAAFAERCLYVTRARCSVIASGRLNRSGDAPPLHWQMLGLQPTDGPYAEMIVLAELDGPVPLVLLARQVDGYLDPPVVAREGDGRLLIHVPARNRGLGSADIMLFTSGQGWNWTDAAAISAEIDLMLPRGFIAASPLVFNFRESSGFALVRRDEDPGCCATGGLVLVDFEQGDNDLAITALRFRETTPAAPDVIVSRDALTQE